MTQTFEQFYRREFPVMVSLAAAVSGSRIAAEDIAQDAFVKAHDRWDEVSAYDKPGAWVRRVTINLALNTRKRVVAETKAKMKLGLEPTIGPPPEPDDAVWKAVSKLPKKQRAAIALFYLEDLSTREIAEALGCKESTARVHLHKARTTLATSLGDLR
jgi:RNA polymerase sigma factor (sigma-70 family)